MWVGAVNLYCARRGLPLVQTRDLGQAWTGRRWKYLNNLTRKYEILLIIVYIAKTWEPNRIDPDSAKTLETAETFVFLYLPPAARRRPEPNFVVIELRATTWNSSQPSRRGGEKKNIKGQLNATLKHCICMRWSLGGRHCVERREAQPRTRDGPWGEECDGDPRLRITARRVRDTRSGRGLRGGSAVVYLDSTP